MKTVTGECRFCGQFQTFEIPDAWEENEPLLSEEATKRCGCEEARVFNAKDTAKNLTFKYIENHLESSEVRTVAKAAVMPVINGDIESITINAGLGVKLVMKTSSKKFIKAKYTVTKESELES